MLDQPCSACSVPQYFPAQLEPFLVLVIQISKGKALYRLAALHNSYLSCLFPWYIPDVIRVCYMRRNRWGRRGTLFQVAAPFLDPVLCFVHINKEHFGECSVTAGFALFDNDVFYTEVGGRSYPDKYHIYIIIVYEGGKYGLPYIKYFVVLHWYFHGLFWGQFKIEHFWAYFS